VVSRSIGGREWPCPACGDVRVFVQPPCADGHTEGGGECPEWACADCGSAFMIGDVDAVIDVLRLRHAA
jgi:hypothetical protein